MGVTQGDPLFYLRTAERKMSAKDSFPLIQEEIYEENIIRV